MPEDVADALSKLADAAKANGWRACYPAVINGKVEFMALSAGKRGARVVPFHGQWRRCEE